MAVPEDVAERIRLARERSTPLDKLAEIAAIDDEILSAVLHGIGEQRRPGTLRLIEPHLQSDREMVRATAAIAAVRADPRGAHDLVLPMLEDESDEVRSSVAEISRAISRAAYVPFLAQAALVAPPMHRDDLAWALAATGDPAALEPLRLLAGDESRFVRRAARNALIWSAIPGADGVLQANPTRWAHQRRRDARRARRSLARAARPDPSVIPTTRVHGRAGTLVGFALVSTISVVPILLDSALPVVTAAAVVVAFAVISVLWGRHTRSSATFDVDAHDRARFEHLWLPDQARIVGPAEHFSRRLVGVVPGLIYVAGPIIAVPIGAELLLPAGGVLSGAATGLFAYFVHLQGRSRRLIARSAQRAFVEVGSRGGVKRRVWMAP